MTEDWVDAVWEESIVRNINSTEKIFDKYKCPPFYKLNITTSGLEGIDREKVTTLIDANGKKTTLLNIYIYIIYNLKYLYFRREIYTPNEER